MEPLKSLSMIKSNSPFINDLTNDEANVSFEAVDIADN